MDAGAVTENSKESRDEIRIRSVEDMYDELKGVLQQCPNISEVRTVNHPQKLVGQQGFKRTIINFTVAIVPLQMEVVGFLARFVQLRDSRWWQFSQVSCRARRLHVIF